ncbi:MAG: FixH family protein [Acetobacteraceae bacterium]
MSDLARRRRGPKSAWDWFPWAVAASLGVVILINAGMIWAALSTFPGQAGPDGYDLSNRYNQVLRAAARQHALGWHVALRLDPENRLTLRLAGPDGRPLAGAVAAVEAERPVGPRELHRFAFVGTAPGRYRAAGRLPRGQWLVSLSLRADGHRYSERRRMIVWERPRPSP